MAIADFTKLTPMTSGEKRAFDEEEGVAVQSPEGEFEVAQDTRIGVPDTREEAHLRTPEITLRDVAISLVEQGVPKSLAKNLFELALEAVNKGMPIETVKTNLNSALKTIKLLAVFEAPASDKPSQSPVSKQPTTTPSTRARLQNLSDKPSGLARRQTPPAQKAA